jgi:hypothetical protein
MAKFILSEEQSTPYREMLRDLFLQRQIASCEGFESFKKVNKAKHCKVRVTLQMLGE